MKNRLPSCSPFLFLKDNTQSVSQPTELKKNKAYTGDRFPESKTDSIPEERQFFSLATTLINSSPNK